MKTLPPLAALVAAASLSGCAGTDPVARRDVDALRAELQAARQENQALARQVEQLGVRVELLSARAARPAAEPARPLATAGPGSPAVAVEPLVPGGLTVVKMEPGRSSRAPAVPTTTPMLEPDPARLEAIARKGGRELATEADAELKAARKKEGLARAHALEGFVARYSRHPQADAALLEASTAYAEAGKVEAACTVARRAVDEYPAGPVLGEALVKVAACEAQKGTGDGERRILARVVSDFPGTPAARKASERLAVISGRPGEDSPSVPARSGP